jgi:hypothetical protein
MTHIKTTFDKFNESVSNLSKVRKFPENFYDIYDLSKFELGKYLNTWFTGEVRYASETPKNRVKVKRGEFKDFIIIDEMWIVKKVDNETSYRLYDKKIAPVSIIIQCQHGAISKQNEKGEDLFIMKAQIHSIDDSSFGVWWYDKPIDELKSIRNRLMKWVNAQGGYGGELNGEEFLKICVSSMGADEDSIDYN